MADEKVHTRARFRPFAQRPEQAFASLKTEVDPKTALVVLDTNVLLAPYKTSATALSEIKRIYSKLKSEDRLLVPGQVAREFARNRPNLVAAIHKQVRDAKTVGINGRYDAPPVLHGLPGHKEATEQMAKVKDALNAYQAALDTLVETVAKWHQSDPVLDVYEGIFDASVVVDLSIDAAAAEQIRRERFEARIPPGYKDKGKDDGGGGDLIIWLTILEAAEKAKRDALFVTEETKEDWFHRAGEQPLFPRYELGREFSQLVLGKAFGLMNLSALLGALGAKEEVVEEIRDKERTPSSALPAIERAALDRLTLAVGERGQVIHHAADAINASIEFRDGARVALAFVWATSQSSLRRTLHRMKAIRDACANEKYDEVVFIFAFDASTGLTDDLVRRYDELATRWDSIVGAVFLKYEDEAFECIFNHAKNRACRLAFPIDLRCR